MTWAMHKLSAVADLTLGKMLDQKKNKGEPRPYLANVNVRWGSFNLSDLREMRFEPHEAERYGLRAGDIVMCEGGEPGRCALWQNQVPGTMLQKALHRIRVRQGVDARFLFYSLFAKGRAGELEYLFTGATIKHLPSEQLAKVSVTLPPLGEQRRIASILGAYDDLIEVNRRRIAVLEEMARRLFEEWFVHFRFPWHAPSADGAASIPFGWQTGQLGDLISLSYGKAMKATDRVPGQVPVIGSSGVVGYHTDALVPRSGIILGRKGNVGSVVWSPVPFFPIDTVFYVESVYPSVYLLQLLRRMPFQSSDAAVPGLNRSGALKLPVTMPPLELVQRFELLVSPMARQVDRLSESQDRLAASRDLLLPRLISGDLPITTAERDLEAVA